MPVPMSEKRTVMDQMMAVFRKAAAERDKRPEMVSDPCDDDWRTPAWVVFEREQLHAAINVERLRHGLPTVDLKMVDRVERLASGHVDYASKYTLYCAEMALGENQPQP
jgi:hypothetical protein